MGASEYRLLSLRLPSELVGQADAIAAELRERGEYDIDTGGDMSRSTIMRRAIELGLRALVRESAIDLGSGVGPWPS